MRILSFCLLVTTDRSSTSHMLDEDEWISTYALYANARYLFVFSTTVQLCEADGLLLQRIVLKQASRSYFYLCFIVLSLIRLLTRITRRSVGRYGIASSRHSGACCTSLRSERMRRNCRQGCRLTNGKYQKCSPAVESRSANLLIAAFIASSFTGVALPDAEAKPVDDIAPSGAPERFIFGVEANNNTVKARDLSSNKQVQRAHLHLCPDRRTVSALPSAPPH